MRLILTTIILTMLAQPVCANNVQDLISKCTKWKDNGYSDGFFIDADGMNALICQVHFSAMSAVGKQNCQFEGKKPEFAFLRWDASAEQLAQFFLNVVGNMPEHWDASLYGFLAINVTSDVFPCKN